MSEISIGRGWHAKDKALSEEGLWVGSTSAVEAFCFQLQDRTPVLSPAHSRP